MLSFWIYGMWDVDLPAMQAVLRSRRSARSARYAVLGWGALFCAELVMSDLGHKRDILRIRVYVLNAATDIRNRDREKPHGSPLPHHRTYGSRIRRFDELNSYRGTRLGSPMLLKKRNGGAIASAGVLDNRHGPWADLLVFHASRTDTPRLHNFR